MELDGQMRQRLALAFVLSLLPGLAFAACSGASISVKDGTGTSQTFCIGGSVGQLLNQTNIVDSTGANIATVNASGQLTLSNAFALDSSIGTTNTNLGPPGATVCATDTGSCSLNALLQRLAQRLTTINSTLGTPAQATGATVQAVPSTTGGVSFTTTQVPNNTTAVVIKASAGQLYGIRTSNNSATIAYGKIYNTTTATCGSGTVVDHFTFQPNANGGWLDMMGEAYSTGITICVTLGYGDSDTTTPTASIYSYTAIYK
jgi:hypothetical protein